MLADDAVTATATARQVVERALRRLGLNEASASASPVELQDGLVALDEMIAGWAADGLPTAAQQIEAATVAGVAQITVDSTAGLAIGLHVSGTGIPAGTTIATIDGPRCATLTQAATATGTALLDVTALPLNASLEAGVIAMLAVRLAEEYGKSPGAVLARDAQRGEEQLRAAFLVVPRTVFDAALTRTPSQRYWGL